MHKINRLYTGGAPFGDSAIIGDLIEQVLPPDVDATFEFFNDGLSVHLYLKPPHAGSWRIQWEMDQPQRIDTGDETNPYPLLADPRCKEILTEQLVKIYGQMYMLCSCMKCEPSD